MKFRRKIFELAIEAGANECITQMNFHEIQIIMKYIMLKKI